MASARARALDTSDPLSPYARTCVAVLRSIDRANRAGSRIWREADPPTRALQRVIEGGAAFKQITNSSTGALQRHDLRSLMAVLENLAKRKSKFRLSKSQKQKRRHVLYLFELGSEAIARPELRSLRYDVKRECKSGQESTEHTEETATSMESTMSSGRVNQVELDAGMSVDIPTTSPRRSSSLGSLFFQTPASAPDQAQRVPTTFFSLPGSTDGAPDAVTTQTQPQSIVASRSEEIEPVFDQQGVRRSSKCLTNGPHRPDASEPPAASSLQPGQILPDQTRFFLSHDTLAVSMQSIRLALRYAIRAELEARRVDPAAPAKTARKPSPPLADIYSAVLGSPRKKAGIDADELAVAIAGAALHRLVFCGDGLDELLFQSLQRRVQDGLNGLEDLCDKHLLSTNLDTVLRRAYYDSLTSVKKDKLSEVSASIAGKIAALLHEHLDGITGLSSDAAATQGTDRLQAAWQQTMHRAVRLRCELSCARERYTFSLPQRRANFDEGWMERADVVSAGGAVRISFFPALMVESVAGKAVVVSKAVLRTM